jgi:hypothetical protein
MKITTKIDFNGYRKLMTKLFYKKFFVIVTLILGVLYAVIAFIGFMTGELDSSSITIYGIGGVFLLFLPLITIKIRTKKGFYSNQMLQEEIVYEFIDDKIIMTGTSFKSEMKWSKVYKVKELNDWFLIYQSKRLMNLIPKEVIGDKILDFKRIITAQKGLKHNLKT